eukprot:jgi/Ulvmu1/5499/UM023_0035.1
MLARASFPACDVQSSNTRSRQGIEARLAQGPGRSRRQMRLPAHKASATGMIHTQAQHAPASAASTAHRSGRMHTHIPTPSPGDAEPHMLHVHAYDTRTRMPADARRWPGGGTAADTADRRALCAFLESIGVEPRDAERLLAACPRLLAESGYGIGMKCMLLRAQGMPADDVAVLLARAPAFFTWRDPDMATACDLFGTETVQALARAPGLLDPAACGWPLVLLALRTLQAELALPRPQVVAAMYDWVLRNPPAAHRPVADVCNISKNVRWLRRRAGHDAPARLVQECGRPELFLSGSADTIEQFLTSEVARVVTPRTSPATPGLPHWL